MKMKLRIVLLALLLAAAVAAPAYAAISGVFDFGRGSFILTGVIRGLGNTSDGNTTTVLTATATITALCQNRGGNIAPGRNPIQLTVTQTSDPLLADSNGNAAVYIRIADPATFSPTPVSPTPREAGCPNGNWTVIGLEVGSVRWQNAQVVVLRDGVQELVQSYSCTDDGVTLTCR